MSQERNSSIAVQQPNPPEGVRIAPAPEGDPAFMAGEGRPYFRLDLWRAVQLHKKVLLACSLCGLLLAAAYVYLVWPVYTSESRVYVQPASSALMSRGGEQRWPFDSNTYDSFIQQQVQNADNPAVLMDALHKVDAGSWQKPGESEDGAAWRLGKALDVTRLGTSYEISITARAGSPQLAAQIANGMAAALIAHSSKQQNAGDVQRLAILRDERNRVQQQLNADLAEQTDLNRKLGMASVGTSTPDLLDSAIVTTRDELIKARTEHDLAAARLASLDASKSGSAAALQGEADELIAQDPGLNAMKGSLYQRRAALVSHMANMTQDNPSYKMDADELAKINNSLDTMMSDLRSKATVRIQNKLRADLERTAGVESRLNGQLGQLSASAAGSTPKMQRANDLASDIVRLRTRYAAVDEELQDLMLKDNVPGAMHLSVTAGPPGSPTVSGVARKAVPMLAGGVVFGLLLVLLLNNLDRKIYVAEDLQLVLGTAPMVSLPSLADVSDAVFEEYVLRLSTVIERTLKQTESRNCVFTGVDSGVGVSTLAKRTREVLEGLGQKAVLVDSNSVLAAQDQASASSGNRGGQSAAVRGARSTALLQKLREEARTHADRVVVTDAAPLTASAETEYLVRSSECVIVVAQSGVTTRPQLVATAQALQRMNVPAVGFVLNNVRMSTADGAFRDSVASVERHLRVQRRPDAQRPKHTLIPASEESPAPAFPSAAAPEASLPAPSETASGFEGFPVADPLLVPEQRAAARSGKENLAQQRKASFEPDSVTERPFGRRPAEGFDDFPPFPGMGNVAQDEGAEAQAAGGSRLNGLRAILFDQGLKNLNRNYENEAEAPQALPAPPPPQPQRAPVTEARAPEAPLPHIPRAETPREVAFTPSPREVVAEPEFLPPREFVPIKGDDAVSGEDSDAKHDRRDPYDHVEILPSWHGQYRRKS
ncbi:MAG: Wzz/FepE/Etk N-terminal domain-containing protein [Terracidiphilus sp.]|nr:Wzz/FepE/Etk N-terminal domain-containing protein [Terracidiphilus sp.]